MKYLLLGVLIATMIFVYMPYADAQQDCNITLQKLSNVKAYGYAPFDAVIEFDGITVGNPNHQVAYEYYVSFDGVNWIHSHTTHDDQTVGYFLEDDNRYYGKVIGYVFNENGECVAKTPYSNPILFTAMPAPTNLSISGDLSDDSITLMFNGISNSRVGDATVTYTVYQNYYGLYWSALAGDYETTRIQLDTDLFTWEQSATLAVSACLTGTIINDMPIYTCSTEEYSNSVTVNRPALSAPINLRITPDSQDEYGSATINYSFTPRDTGMWSDHRIEYRTNEMSNFELLDFADENSGTMNLPCCHLLDNPIQFRVVTTQWTWTGFNEATSSIFTLG